MYDFIVIGKGLIGSAAFRHLAEHSTNTLLIGPDEPADPSRHQGVFGAHNDEAGLTHLHGKSPVWGELCRRSIGRPQRIEWTGAYATNNKGSTGVSYVWDYSLGEIVNALVNAGLAIDFLHEFPYAARAKFPFMEQGPDGWWRLPSGQHGTIPFLFSLQARKPH